MNRDNLNIEYEYDIVITSVNGEFDRKVRNALFHDICKYKLPRNLRDKFQNASFHRIYLDNHQEDEHESAKEQVLEIVRKSRYIIVVCSPLTPQSQRIHSMLEVYVNQDRMDHILVVLLEGEPDEAFPEEVLSRKILHNGVYELEEVEPLAANIKAYSKRKVLKLLQEEQLRLLAPVIGCSFDDLRQRHRVRRIRLLVTAISAVSMIILFFSAFTLYQWLYVEHQVKIATEQEKMREAMIGRLFHELNDKYVDRPEAKPVINDLLYNNFANLQDLATIPLNDAIINEILQITGNEDDYNYIVKMILQRQYISKEKALETLKLYKAKFEAFDNYDPKFYQAAVEFTRNIDQFQVNLGNYVYQIDQDDLGDLQLGDIIILCDDKPFTLYSVYGDKSSAKDFGEKVKITYLRLDKDKGFIRKEEIIDFMDYIINTKTRDI